MATKPQQKEDGGGDDDIRAIFKKMIVKMPPPISPIKDPAQDQVVQEEVAMALVVVA